MNGPTASLIGDQTYKLVATKDEVHKQWVILMLVLIILYLRQKLSQEFHLSGKRLVRKVGSDESDKLNGSNANNLFRGNGGDDVLNGSGGNDTYQFIGNFGNDKVLEYGDGIDILQIGAARQNVWFERQGRRGDELKVTVNDGTHMGTISVGRQYNPYSAMQAVEQIQFGFDGAVSDKDSLYWLAMVLLMLGSMC